MKIVSFNISRCSRFVHTLRMDKIVETEEKKFIIPSRQI